MKIHPLKRQYIKLQLGGKLVIWFNNVKSGKVETVLEILQDLMVSILFMLEVIVMPLAVYRWNYSMQIQENYFADMILFMDNLMRYIINLELNGIS